MKNKLTAIVLNSERHDFSEQHRALKVQENQYFTITIKEYLEAQESIKKQIMTLQNEKSDIDTSLEQENQRLFKQAQERFNSGGEWIKTEKYQGETITHAEVSYKENLRRASEKVKSLKNDKDKKINELQNKLSEIEKDYENVCWSWTLVKKRSDKPIGRNESIAKGNKQLNLNLDSHLHGGGLAWIEPFHDGEKPTGSTKNGLYVQSMGTPDVITAEWYGYDESQMPVKIDKPVRPMSKVQLHIYTKNLYGINIKVEMKANGETLKANSYGSTIVVTAQKDSKHSTTVETKHEIIDSKDFFLAEVEIYDYSEPNAIKPPNGVITGHLVDDSTENQITLTPNVQKAVLDFYIDPVWSIGKPKIIIKPTIHFSGQKKDLDATLQVNGQEAPEIPTTFSGNNPVFVDNIETNFKEFHPCGYDKFEINDGQRTVDLLEDKSIPPLNLFELVAGPKENTHDITISLDTKTENCAFEDSPQDHTDKVITLSQYPEKEIGEEKPQEEEKKSSTSFSSKLEVKAGDKNNVKYKTELGFTGGLEISEHNDKSLKFKARYIYDYQPLIYNGISVHPIIQYLWLGKGVKTNTYLIQTKTCRYQQDVNILTYPDVAWSLKLSYTNSTEQKELVSNQTYKDTKKAKFKRPPQKWMSVGDKSLGLSLGAKWDKETEYDATADITEKVRELVDKLGVIGKFVNNAFLGKENKGDKNNQHAKPENKEALEKIKKQQEEKAKAAEATKEKELKKLRDNLNSAKAKRNQATTEKEIKAANDNIKSLQRKLDSRSKELDLKLTRSVASIEIQWPQIEAEFNWSRENIDQHGPYYNQTGVVLEGALQLSPLVGLKATLDFLALAQRAHPVALAVIAAADITMAIIGDGSEITCELTAEGTFGGKIQGFLNTTTKENSFNKDDRNANSKQLAELKCDLEFKLKIAIKINTKVKAVFAKVVIKAEAEASATAKWTGKAPLDADDYGWYIAPELSFEGLEIIGQLNIEGEATSHSGKSKYGSISSNNELKWQAIDAWKEPKKFEKTYFIKS
ncbi:hypothetical protein [Chryseobacterium oryctis]|uniref:Uncharacterized protein n=1 Tax=Chryseobacterium oryctis TaxID=2952618 RepID=A0ABT3HMS9_9FLAO|nr:hypothetical protein [Chryseobacterium oryctis]MCW3161094.1 hypothetical protein [Chryseobacterium oryctis]